MGKARILGGGTDGLYTIEILEDRTRAQTNRATAVARVASLDARISELTVDLADAQSVVDDAATYQDQMIAAYQTALANPQLDTADARQDMIEAGEALTHAAAKRDAIARNISALKSERLSVQRRIDLIDDLPPLRQISAWCADLIEDLSGEVATAEVPGEIGQVIIQPGYTDGAAWSPTDDGAIQPALSGTAASVFYNLAMMPGWQKWRPTFRIATISNITNDLCDITLDAATSSQQSLGVNAQSSYTGVPIMYMDCNGDAFEDGDKVLVAFSGNTDAPMVVGFEQEPKQCTNYTGSVSVRPFATIAGLYVYDDATCVGGGLDERELSSSADQYVGIRANLGGFDRITTFVFQSDFNPTIISESYPGSDHAVRVDSEASTTGDHSNFQGDLSVTFDITGDTGGLPDIAVKLTAQSIIEGTLVCQNDASYATVIGRTSLLEVDGFSLDLQTLDLEIYGYGLWDSTWRSFGDDRYDEFALHYERSADAGVYLDVEFRGVIQPPGEPIRLPQFHAAFYREKDGSWYRVQSRYSMGANHEQLPDHESLPVV